MSFISKRVITHHNSKENIPVRHPLTVYIGIPYINTLRLLKKELRDHPCSEPRYIKGLVPVKFLQKRTKNRMFLNLYYVPIGKRPNRI